VPVVFARSARDIFIAWTAALRCLALFAIFVAWHCPQLRPRWMLRWRGFDSLARLGRRVTVGRST
jgi:hypothetical protein